MDRSTLVRLFLAAAVALPGCFDDMRHQRSIRPSEVSPPGEPNESVPVSGGEVIPDDKVADTMKNPYLDIETPEVLAQARDLYTRYCLMCHGEKGDGHGPVGEGFVPMPADLRSENVTSKGDGRLFRSVSLGVSTMPPMRGTMTAGERWKVLLHVRRFGEKR